MRVTLDKRFKTGILWLDAQHRSLFEKMSGLVGAIEMGGGKEEVTRLIDFLDEYVVVHFHDEEKAMGSSQYPGTLSHMKEHTYFIEDLSRLKAELKKGVSAPLVLKVRKRIVLWLKDHIGGADKELGAFLLKETALPGKKG